MPASSAAALSSAPLEIVTQIVTEINGGLRCPSVRKIKQRIREVNSAPTVEFDDEQVARVASI